MSELKQRFFEAGCANRYELVHPLAPEDFECLHALIDGTPRAESWQPIKVEVVRENIGMRLQRSDAPWFGGHALVFDAKAVHALETLLIHSGELLALQCDDRDLHVFNPSAVVDALNETESTIERFRDGRIRHIRKHVFKADLVRPLLAFKLPHRASSAYLSQRFVDAWEKAGLRGLTFDCVWEEQ
jgi:hypothetical protein